MAAVSGMLRMAFQDAAALEADLAVAIRH